MDLPTTEVLEAGLDSIRQSPAEKGRLELIVCRPQVEARQELAEAVLDPAVGLVGDSWGARRNPDPNAQITVMNVRAAALVAGDTSRRSLAGDQLYVDFDIGVVNCPAGTRLAIGSAVVEISVEPHTGCGKFSQRFGPDALRFVNSEVGAALRLRGANARVIVGGTVRVGDRVVKDAPLLGSDGGAVAGDGVGE